MFPQLTSMVRERTTHHGDRPLPRQPLVALSRRMTTGLRRLYRLVGTSISTPIVAGFLAMARQKWPDATSNQLLQLLIHTTVNPDGGWNQYTGYGVASPATMMNTDPSQYPDVNPLADKGGGSSPTPEEIAQYVDGVVPPAEIVFDNSHTPTVAWTNPSSEQPRTRTRHTSVRARATTRSRRNLRDAVRGRGPLCGVPASRVGRGRRSRAAGRGRGTRPRAREARALLRPRR